MEFNYTQWGYKLNYTAGMVHLVKRHPESMGGVCVVVSDDPTLGAEVAEAALRIIKCWRVVRLFGNERHEQDSFNTLPENARCSAAKQVITNVDALAQADYVLGMSSLFCLIDSPASQKYIVYY